MGRRRPFFVAVAVCAATVVAGAAAGSHANSASITITDCCLGPSGVSKASLYPSNIGVSDETNSVTGVTVTLGGFNHTSPEDVDVLMVSPNGKAIVLMSDAGGFNTASNLTVTFDQDAAGDVPDNSALTSTSYRPHNWGASPGPLCDGVEPDPDAFPAPAPASPYVTSLASLKGQNPNGTWSLFVVDDCAGDSGAISGGWSVNLTTGTTAVVLQSFNAIPSPHSVVLRWRTASETQILGFNVVRFANGHTRRVNGSLISAKAAGANVGATYRLVDRSIRPGAQYTYRLQTVARDGKRSWVATAGLRTSG